MCLQVLDTERLRRTQIQLDNVPLEEEGVDEGLIKQLIEQHTHTAAVLNIHLKPRQARALVINSYVFYYVLKCI